MEKWSEQALDLRPAAAGQQPRPQSAAADGKKEQANHQEKNAAYFASKQAALALAPDVSDAIFKDTILRLLADRDRQRVLSGNISDLFPPDAAAKLAKMILEKIK